MVDKFFRFVRSVATSHRHGISFSNQRPGSTIGPATLRPPMRSRPILRIPVRRYRHAPGLGVLAAALVLSWAGEGSFARAEGKVSTGQGGVAVNRAAAGQPASRLSAPVRTDAGISKKHRAGKNPSLGQSMTSTKAQPARRAHRHARGAKRLRPQAALTPKPDVSYHGMLEQPQRYAPQYQHSKGRAPNPNAGALLHDHFQELDKNRDGSIDPFERAFGRLDMDRDLADRQWQ
jgi:hypothetical protein